MSALLLVITSRVLVSLPRLTVLGAHNGTDQIL